MKCIIVSLHNILSQPNWSSYVFNLSRSRVGMAVINKDFYHQRSWCLWAEILTRSFAELRCISLYVRISSFVFVNRFRFELIYKTHRDQLITPYDRIWSSIYILLWDSFWDRSTPRSRSNSFNQSSIVAQLKDIVTKWFNEFYLLSY